MFPTGCDLRFAAAGFGVAIALASSSAPALAKTNGCEAAEAQRLIGKEAPSDAEVKTLTGARVVRRVAPGDVATMDYRPDRVTLGLERGRIVTTRCG